MKNDEKVYLTHIQSIHAKLEIPQKTLMSIAAMAELLIGNCDIKKVHTP
jgi:hypothetical protein